MRGTVAASRFALQRFFGSAKAHSREAREHRDGNREKTRRPLMEKSIAAPFLAAFPSFLGSSRIKTYPASLSFSWRAAQFSILIRLSSIKSSCAISSWISFLISVDIERATRAVSLIIASRALRRQGRLSDERRLRLTSSVPRIIQIALLFFVHPF